MLGLQDRVGVARQRVRAGAAVVGVLGVEHVEEQSRMKVPAEQCRVDRARAPPVIGGLVLVIVMAEGGVDQHLGAIDRCPPVGDGHCVRDAVTEVQHAAVRRDRDRDDRCHVADRDRQVGIAALAGVVGHLQLSGVAAVGGVGVRRVGCMER